MNTCRRQLKMIFLKILDYLKISDIKISISFFFTKTKLSFDEAKTPDCPCVCVCVLYNLLGFVNRVEIWNESREVKWLCYNLRENWNIRSDFRRFWMFFVKEVCSRCGSRKFWVIWLKFVLVVDQHHTTSAVEFGVIIIINNSKNFFVFLGVL